jgi:hypothetical protein
MAIALSQIIHDYKEPNGTRHEWILKQAPPVNANNDNTVEPVTELLLRKYDATGAQTDTQVGQILTKDLAALARIHEAAT